ncbi:hypothetical protein [uncultured Dechloromonas sp.]|uniref:hypothetical protein n=1 Tax=uncultured Dechloromonas sp. TaxID=171719 RepID=UPI0025D495A6|nr:hypothetical protein [uncultured Dechloromonas sp.]
MKTLVQILRAEGKAYKDPKSGRISKRCVCQCVVHQTQEDGEIKLDVGVLVVPEALCPVKPVNSDMDSLPDVPAGDYLAEYGLAIHWQTKELGGQLKSLTRRDAKPQAQAAAKA